MRESPAPALPLDRDFGGAGAVPSSPPSDRSGARLGGAVLAYMLCVTLIITLLPFRFVWPS
ncbi:MAG: hypothetical protein ABI877_15255, partial [Gemmatimonadaceae bacterium]